MGLVLMQEKSRKYGLDQAKNCERICNNPSYVHLNLAGNTFGNDNWPFGGTLCASADLGGTLCASADLSDAAFTKHCALKTNDAICCSERVL